MYWAHATGLHGPQPGRCKPRRSRPRDIFSAACHRAGQALVDLPASLIFLFPCACFLSLELLGPMSAVSWARNDAQPMLAGLPWVYWQKASFCCCR